MEVRVFWRSLRQRWYLVLVLLVVTATATFLVAQRMGPSYEATGTVLVFPPSQTPGSGQGSTPRGNPYLSLGGVNQARDVLVRTLTSKSVADAFDEQHPDTEFEVVPDFTNSAPIILFTVESSAPGAAVDALLWLMDRVPTELDELQAGLDLPASEKVTALALTQDERPATVRRAQVRAAVLVAAVLGGAGLLLVALVDGLLGTRHGIRRGTRRPEVTASRAARSPVGPDEPPRRRGRLAAASVGRDPP